MSEGPFSEHQGAEGAARRLGDYRFATRKPSRAAAARELLDRAFKAFFENLVGWTHTRW